MQVVTLAERPDLADRVFDFPGAWPEHMMHDPTAELYYEDVLSALPQHVLLAVEDGAAVARAFTVPLRHDPGPAELPDDGWEWAIRSGARTRLEGWTPNLVSALEITIQTGHRGRGLAAVLLEAMRRNVRRLGFDDLVAPVRPNGRGASVDEPMTDYVARTRDDGLPVDPWLGVHVRAGGTVVGVARTSMVIAGALDRWREWTGLPFDATGPVRVPGALVPVDCDVRHDRAVYVEPNVWVHHRLT
ncbi:N-acetyltransferase [Thalassiella azotivora]